VVSFVESIVMSDEELPPVPYMLKCKFMGGYLDGIIIDYQNLYPFPTDPGLGLVDTPEHLWELSKGGKIGQGVFRGRSTAAINKLKA